MFFHFISLSYVAVILSAAAYFVLGSIWYSPRLFGKPRFHEREHSFGLKLSQTLAYFGEAIISLMIAYSINYLVVYFNANSPWKGLLVGFWVWLAFIATTQFSSFLWGYKSLMRFLVNAGFLLIGFCLIGLIAGIFKF